MIFRRKKLLVIAITSIVVVGGVFVLANYVPSQIKNTASTLTPAQLSQEKIFNDIAERDSDHDGLKDWEEALWKTDLNNPDTDGDGTLDGQEVKDNRNPTLKGPNDSLNDHPIKTSAMASKDDPHLTETNKFARSVFSKYMALKQGGVTINAGSEAGLIQKMLQEQSLEIPAKIFTKKDLVFSSDSVAALHDYGSAIAQIILDHSIDSKDIGIIARDSIDHNNPDEIKEIDPVLQSYQAMFELFRKVKVPPSATNIHIALLNSLSDMIETTKGIRALYTDPLLALKAFGHYVDALAILARAIADVRDFFPKKGIVFSASEAGYLFGHPIAQ